MNLLQLKNGRQISVEIKSWNKEIFETINEKEQVGKAFYHPNNIHEKISAFWLVKSSAVFF